MTYAANFSANEFAPAVVIGNDVMPVGSVIRIVDETPGDIAAREALLDSAFGPGRETKTCERLREGRLPARNLSLVAKDGCALVGTLRLWHIEAGPGRPALLLGPIAVAASHRSHGLGARLICEALYRCVTAGHRAVLLVGDGPYYERFGFAQRLTEKLIMPGFVEKDRFLGLELTLGSLEGASGAVTATGISDLPRFVPPNERILARCLARLPAGWCHPTDKNSRKINIGACSYSKSHSTFQETRSDAATNERPAAGLTAPGVLAFYRRCHWRHRHSTEASAEFTMSQWPVHARISGPIVMIGLGSIGKGMLPLIERHFTFDKSRFVVIDPDDSGRHLLDERGIAFKKLAITRENYRDVLVPLLTEGDGQGFCVNLSVDTSSLAIMELCREIGALYIDTVVEPWPGFYFDHSMGPEARTNYALRETLLAAKHRNPGGTTAVSCCGANPGMVSWFVKQALLDLSSDLQIGGAEPRSRDEWARLAQQLGVKGIHIAERDTQRAKTPKPMQVFVNTWSVEGFLSEGMQPAELGWGTHEKWMPENAGTHKAGCGAAIYINQPGANTRVRSWTPTPKAQYGFLVTHNEAISIADYLTVREKGTAVYRPTCHYAYHPANDAVLSLHEMFGQAGRMQEKHHILDENEIVDGIDELGVLLYGHAKNAYWYGSQLSIEETRRIAPYQNATGLQVSSAVLAGMVWALENPQAGIVEADEIDFRRCLDVQRPYLGPVIGEYTDWTPLTDRPGFFPEDIDTSDPWQFRNVLVR